VQGYKILHKLWDIRYFSIETWTVSGQQERSRCPLTVTPCDFFCLIGQKRAAVPNEEKPGLFYLRLVVFLLAKQNTTKKFQKSLQEALCFCEESVLCFFAFSKTNRKVGGGGMIKKPKEKKGKLIHINERDLWVRFLPEILAYFLMAEILVYFIMQTSGSVLILSCEFR
jgi:hypothetical protein